MRLDLPARAQTLSDDALIQEITPRHWLIALVIAGLAHAALALALMQRSVPLPASSRSISMVLGDGGQGGGADRPSGADALQPVASPALGLNL